MLYQCHLAGHRGGSCYGARRTSGCTHLCRAPGLHAVTAFAALCLSPQVRVSVTGQSCHSSTQGAVEDKRARLPRGGAQKAAL